MTDKLKPFAAHNLERGEIYRTANQSEVGKPTGVECPTCGKELAFTDDILRMSNPPKRQVKCSEDHYHFITA